jgi:hypothetical protein
VIIMSKYADWLFFFFNLKSILLFLHCGCVLNRTAIIPKTAENLGPKPFNHTVYEVKLPAIVMVFFCKSVKIFEPACCCEQKT